MKINKATIQKKAIKDNQMGGRERERGREVVSTRLQLEFSVFFVLNMSSVSLIANALKY